MVGWLFLHSLSGQPPPRSQTISRSPKLHSILFNRIPSELGLSQNVINCILQDKAGFLWVGTKDGLNRFDGYQFKVYRYDPNDPTSISDSFITTLFEDHRGRLWVGTEKGLNLYNSQRESFYRILPDQNNQNSISYHQIRAIAEDQQGAIWIGTFAGDLDKLELHAGASENPLAGAQFTHITHYPNDPRSLGDNLVSQILVDDSGVIWVNAGTEIYHLTADTANVHHAITRFSLPEEPESFRGFCRGRNGKIWLAGSKGLFEWETAGRRAVFHPYQPPLFPSLGTIIEDQNGTVWFGSRWGLIRFDSGENRFEVFQADPRAHNTILEYGINAIYEDTNGALWFGANGNGLFRYDSNAERFAHYKNRKAKLALWTGTSVRSLYETNDGDLLIGPASTAGIVKLNRATGATEPFLASNPMITLVGATSSEREKTIGITYSMVEDKTGALWAGTDRYLLKIDLRKGKAEHVISNDVRPDPRKYRFGNVVYKLFVDRAENLWAATLYGIYRYDRLTEKFTEYLFEDGEVVKTLDSSYPVIYEAPDGFFWIGTTNGLFRFDPNSGTFKIYRNDPQNATGPSHNTVRAIADDPFEPNVLWLGTAGGGLNRFDMATETFTVFTEKDGLPNNVVYAILSDEDGNLWMSTNNGITRFNSRTRVFKNFDVKDGLQDNEFNSCAYFKSRSGELFFGGINGFNAFYPGDVKDNPKPPPVVFTGFQILNRPVSFKSPDSPLKQTITETREISLSYQKRFFSFEFAALDFTEPSKNQYAYKLEGFDKDWVQNGAQRTAFYTNVPPGTYVFRVIATNNDGVWNKQGASIRITVLPPFWRAWWFLSLLSVSMIGMVFLLYRRRVSQLERAKALQETFARQLIEEQENDRKRIAAELHDGLGQSLLIIKNRAFLGAKATEKESANTAKAESAHEQFAEISDSAAEALEQVREIAYYLRPSQLERLGLTSAIEEMLERVADSSGIVFDVQLTQLDGVFPPEHEINFYRIVQESVNNILKHSGATSARVIVKKDENGVKLLIKDNGKGFIYDEGGTTNPDKTGFGLKGMAERARILGGRYEVRSTPGQGTAIVVQIEK